MSIHNLTAPPVIAVSSCVDFEAGTWTLEPVAPFSCSAGRYAIISEHNLKLMVTEINILTKALKELGVKL